jgi:NADH dehydrogenase FAD-containing subunit
MSTASNRHRVVIVGGGFGGLRAAKRLRKAEVEITVLDRTNHHLFQPLHYQVATGILSEGHIAPPLRGILGRHRNIQVELAEVTGFDLENRAVVAARPLGTAHTLPYDSLIVAPGASTSYFGHGELARHSLPMKTIDDALNLRRRIFAAFELAETAPTNEERRTWLTFAVVGGGPTGCEVAGQIAELARRTLRKDFRAIDPTCAEVLLVEADDRILRAFGDRLSRKAASGLERVGVDVRTGTKVTGIDGDGMDIETPDGPSRVATRTVVWAAGVQASGYVINSLLVPWCTAALELLVRGVSDFQSIDRTWMITLQSGMGPFGMIDRMGLGVVYHVAKLIGDTTPNPQALESARYLDEHLIQKGRLGVASGQGFYSYPNPAFERPDFI